MTEILNGRLFTTVRDLLGLTYDVSFELSLFDRLPSGWWSVHVTSTPEVRVRVCVCVCIGGGGWWWGLEGAASIAASLVGGV